MEDWKIFGPILAALIALYGFILNHLRNPDGHPAKKDIVYRDVCDSKMKRIEDCIEGEIRVMTEQIKSLEKSTNAGNKALANSIESVKDALDRLMDSV
jgi:hypothetical protein